ncbi:MAG: AmmeMemoRadiSam system radical SAM enzyme [Firmicutes bacterium]|jgi:pyruvate formate lyase activating enzyme|nr:AmmeMemoRadiSam system radical SAM enzyme [Bacillota bacterium]HQD39999.1 AmmeMemoRadiSam system radical SAM enzyme [Bacillota bacterium]
MKKGLFWQREGERVRCQLCPHSCLLAAGQRGMCFGRENREGELLAATYGRVSSCAVDPVEKKPLYHFFPGSLVLSVGTVGCNFSCCFCQNWHISQQEAPTEYMSPERLVELALEVKARDPRVVGIAYTYSEPLVWYEYVKEAASLAKKEGLVNVLVTNGFINPEPLRELLPFISAANLDLKAAGDAFYRKYCGGNSQAPKEAAKLLREKCHLEITTLLITGLNDSAEEVGALVDWIAEELGEDVPLHLSRYFPNYKLTLPPTPIETMRQAKEIAQKKLRYVYLGNIGIENTYCPYCSEVVVIRQRQVKVNLAEGKCPGCGRLLPIVSMKEDQG